MWRPFTRHLRFLFSAPILERILLCCVFTSLPCPGRTDCPGLGDVLSFDGPSFLPQRLWNCWRPFSHSFRVACQLRCRSRQVALSCTLLLPPYEAPPSYLFMRLPFSPFLPSHRPPPFLPFTSVFLPSVLLTGRSRLITFPSLFCSPLSLFFCASCRRFHTKECVLSCFCISYFCPSIDPPALPGQ